MKAINCIGKEGKKGEKRGNRMGLQMNAINQQLITLIDRDCDGDKKREANHTRPAKMDDWHTCIVRA